MSPCNAPSQPTRSLILFFLACFWQVASQSASALTLCDSKYNKPDYDSYFEDPDLSHEIFSEHRWRCVVSKDTDTGLSYQFSDFTGFSNALEQCSTATQAAYAPEGGTYEYLLNSIDSMALSLQEGGVLHEDVTEEEACRLWSVSRVADSSTSYVGQYSFALNPPATWRLISGELEGETIKFAGLLAWELSGSDIAGAYLEYTPNFTASRCADPVCTGG